MEQDLLDGSLWITYWAVKGAGLRIRRASRSTPQVLAFLATMIEADQSSVRPVAIRQESSMLYK